MSNSPNCENFGGSLVLSEYRWTPVRFLHRQQVLTFPFRSSTNIAEADIVLLTKVAQTHRFESPLEFSTTQIFHLPLTSHINQAGVIMDSTVSFLPNVP